MVLVDVTHDSREAGPGVLFACRPGARADGHDFAPQAVAAGSPALLVERAVATDVPQVQVPSVAATLGLAAAAVHGHPAERLLPLGVTGTNGKTTVVTLLEAVLTAAAMEVSSHGLALGRMVGTRVDVAGFTNLSQ
ncbi:MAG: UDP-N-acetylmuramoyl-L-alanyl-D-glutamate--2,6-diaminopimelate ligase, partial [Actinobacteria bacterium QS_5_72_10]